MICYNFSLDYNKLSLNRPGVYLFLLKMYAYLIINFEYIIINYHFERSSSVKCE